MNTDLLAKLLVNTNDLNNMKLLLKAIFTNKELKEFVKFVNFDIVTTLWDNKTLVFFLIKFSFCWQLVVGVTVSEQSSDLSSFGSHFHNFTTIKWLSGTLHRP